ncbi:MAG: hypothetical protein JWO25_1656 [Alphaproteobacteria bacterium]|nr:hypothetical protein [Alphaproteobacteria bacterium]
MIRMLLVAALLASVFWLGGHIRPSLPSIAPPQAVLLAPLRVSARIV